MNNEDPNKLTHEVVCKNCGNHFEGVYCNMCGQKVINERITIKHLFEITFDSFNIDKGLIYTIKLMFTNPGKLINDYLNGRTKDFYNPLKYLLLIAGISALLMLSFKIFDANLENTNKLMGIDQEATQFQSAITGYMKKFLQLIAILTLPFYSLVSKWIFKKHKLYYAEHLTINSYLFAQITLIQIVTILLVYFIPELTKFMLLIGFGIFTSYYTYALRGVFKIKTVRSFLSSIAIYILGMVLMLFFVMTVTIIVMFILKLSGVNLKELIQ